MNLVSTTVGLSIMGAAAPAMMQMSIAPFEAQKRAQNLGIAESAAVTYAAENEGAIKLSQTPESCFDPVEMSSGAYSITCEEGEGTPYKQTVTRSFRLATCDDNDGNNGHGNSGGYDCSNPGGYANNSRVFAHASPTKFSGHQCPEYDAWGVNGYNDKNAAYLGGACIPVELWTKNNYKNSNPDDWLYDVNNYNGWGSHQDY